MIWKGKKPTLSSRNSYAKTFGVEIRQKVFHTIKHNFLIAGIQTIVSIVYKETALKEAKLLLFPTSKLSYLG